MPYLVDLVETDLPTPYERQDLCSFTEGYDGEKRVPEVWELVCKYAHM